MAIAVRFREGTEGEINIPPKKSTRHLNFQPSFFRCELLVFGEVYRNLFNNDWMKKHGEAGEFLVIC